ncbi:MAG TPA: hypothetical protein VEM93_06620 [Actinomycetota bacterium]|nr:hypothetical protein [Actinomycetota bacterium]
MRFARRRTGHFDVPVEHLVLRITGPDDLYEEARAAGMSFWEQIQSFAVRNRDFQNRKRPMLVPVGAPPIIREMAELSARAGVGPMFAFQGALTEFVGRTMANRLRETVVSCGGDHYVVSRRRTRLPLHQPGVANGSLGIVLKPDLGPQGVYSTLGKGQADGLVVVASSCILADAAAAAASAILTKRGAFGAALRYLKDIPGVHGAVVVQGERIGVAGSLELAA